MSRQKRNTPRLFARYKGCVLSAIEARKVGYTIAVPQPSSANSPANAPKLPAIANPSKASPCDTIPHNNKSFLQTQSDSRPPPILNVAQKAFIAGLTVFFSLRLLSFRPGFFPENEHHIPAPTAAPEVDERLLAQLSRLMDTQKYWRTEGLTIRQLAEKMQVKEYRLRQAINQYLGYRNFNDYLNGYRVREACAVLSDPEKWDLTVLEIACDLGYASLAPFNKAFKDTTVMAPTEWRRLKMGTNPP